MTNPPYRYRLYDLVVESDSELSLAVAAGGAPADDWHFEQVDVDDGRGRLVHDVVDFDGRRRLQVWIGDDGDCIHFSHGETRAIWDRVRREIRLDAGADMSLRPAIILERVIAPIALLLQRKRHVALHASAVADAQGRAQIFVGDSGAGKSTTALELMRRGMAILADDLVMIDADRGRLLSATPSVRLFDRPSDVPEAIDAQLVMPERDKYWYQLGRRIDAEEPPEVGGIFALEPAEECERAVIDEITGREAIVRVIAQAFDLTEADGPWRTRRFRTLCELARDRPIHRVRYPRGDRSDPAQVRALADYFGVHTEEGDADDR